MYKTGAIAGKFLPPHRGHLTAILHAASKCEQLYVVVSENRSLTCKLCGDAGLPVMDLKLRARWLSRELNGFDHIKVLMLDEGDIPFFPEGWGLWAEKFLNVIPEPVEAMFGGEIDYSEPMKKFLPSVKYEVLDRDSVYGVSGTQIRSSPLQYWDFILDSVRPFLAKKILITGTESTGKTTLANSLAKIFNTSWSTEVGRYYSTKHMGGNEAVFTPHDFELIAYEQYMSDEAALYAANRIAFFDSDAVVTLFYARMYLPDHDDFDGVIRFIDPSRYDHILLLTPDVAWVADGFRFNPNSKKRWELHEYLMKLYIEFGFSDKITIISGDYDQRLENAERFVRSVLKQANNI